jgi:hypothetical protein
MGLGLNTDDLLTAVRNEAFLPTAGDQSAATLLAFADDVLATLISATIRPGREGRWLTSLDITIVPGTTSYELPPRALAQAVRGVMMVLPDGTTYPLTEMDPLVLKATYLPGSTVLPRWYGFIEEFLELGTVSADSGWSLRVYYLRSPNKLIATGGTDSSAINSFTEAGDVELTLPAIPGADIGTDGARVDIISGQEPYSVLAYDAVCNTTSVGVTLNLDTFDTSRLQPTAIQNHSKDYVCAAGTTVYPPIPRALWPALVRGTAEAALQATSSPGAGAMMARAQMAREAAVRVLMPRDDRRSRPIVGPRVRSRRPTTWCATCQGSFVVGQTRQSSQRR